MKSFYKVVADEDGVLKSAMIRHIGGAGVTYEVGKWVRPALDGSKLFCFTSIGKARRFIKENRHGARLFRCKARNPKLNKDPVSAVLDHQSIMHFWGKAERPKFYMLGSVQPMVLADEVMLTKEVKAS